LLGSDFASLSISWSEFAGSEGCATIAVPPAQMSPIGAKLVSGS
jgi:hypothetical protein